MPGRKGDTGWPGAASQSLVATIISMCVCFQKSRRGNSAQEWEIHGLPAL